jgi:hypothetical protein
MSIVNVRLFELFSKTINETPAKEVLRAVELQRRRLEADLATQRVLLEDAASLLTFFNFLEGDVRRSQADLAILPAEQIDFYRKTVERLVAAGELSTEIAGRFDRIYPTVPFKAVEHLESQPLGSK